MTADLLHCSYTGYYTLPDMQKILGVGSTPIIM